MPDEEFNTGLKLMRVMLDTLMVKAKGKQMDELEHTVATTITSCLLTICKPGRATAAMLAWQYTIARAFSNGAATELASIDDTVLEDLRKTDPAGAELAVRLRHIHARSAANHAADIMDIIVKAGAHGDAQPTPKEDPNA